MTPPYIAIGGGHELFVRDWGGRRGGPTALLLASWGMDSRLWSSTMTALNDAGVRTVAYDRRGHGRSTDPGIVDYDLLADDLHEVVSALDLRSVTIVAHSAAAGEAIRYLSRHGSERVARIIIVGGTGPRMLAAPDNPTGLPPAMLDMVLSQLSSDLEGWIDANAEPFAPGATSRTIDWLAAMLLDVSRRILVDFQRVAAETDLTDEARSIAVPTTIIHGDRDASAPIDLTARRYAEIIDGAELIVYEGVAHGVMIDARDRLASDILARIIA